MPSSNQLPTVRDIHIYPVKSCGYVQLQECQVDNLGIKYDRRFMIVNDDDSKRFVTQRKYASLTALKTAINEAENALTLSAEGQEPLLIPLSQDLTKLSKRQVLLWKDELTVYDVGDKAATWCSQFLENHRESDKIQNNVNVEDPIHDDEEDAPIAVRLVTLDDPKTGVYDRPAHPKLNGIHSSFTDYSPISFGFNSSLVEVNKWLIDTDYSNGVAINMIRFRNNITIDGTLPWDEDQWLVVKVGEVTMYLIQPIARCPIPCIDQDTGEKDRWGSGKSVTDFLKITRKFAEEPTKGHFSCDVIPLNAGKIRVGDTIEVLERIPEQFKQVALPH